MLINKEEEEILKECVLYIPNSKNYAFNGLKISDATKEEQKKYVKYGMYQGIERYRRRSVVTSRKQTLEQAIKKVDAIFDNIYFKSKMNRETTTNCDIHNAMLMCYIIFVSMYPVLKHNHSQKISKQNELLQSMGSRKSMKMTKHVSQLMMDIEKIEFDINTNKYTKGEYLFQNYSEIEEDRKLFDFFLGSLKLLAETKTMTDFMFGLACSIQKFTEKYNFKTVVAKDLKGMYGNGESNFKNIEYNSINEDYDSIIKEWDEDDDHFLRNIFLSLFDIKLSDEAKQELLNNSNKLKQMDEQIEILKTKNNDELITYMENTYSKEKSLELEDKLMCMGLMESYFYIKNEENKRELWS